MHHQWQRGAGARGIAVFGSGRHGQRDVAIEVRRRCQFERGQVPTRNVHRRRAVGSIEGVGAIGEPGTRRQAAQCEGERFRTVDVIGVGLDGGQQDRVVFKARVEHLSDIDVVQHAAQAISVPGAELEFLVAIGSDRNVEAVVLHARGRGVQGANELATPVQVDMRIFYTGTRCIVERHVVRGAGLRIDSGVEVARITGVALKFDDLIIAAGTVDAGFADFNRAPAVVGVPDAVAELADIEVEGRTAHSDFLEVGRGNHAATGQRQTRGIGDWSNDDGAGRRSSGRDAAVVGRVVGEVGGATPVAGGLEVNRRAIGCRGDHAAGGKRNGPGRVCVKAAIGRQAGQGEMVDAAVNVTAA
ncbi:hypothetical protein PS659_05973 [Pseudomonas fluorescens]|uniref:Uncharacterized protein n=1 Tax=Pseudomonas fluorescens TaxID=294 RepID=A0A5E6Y4D5_PSEFL|nr:hypothetical protein PS659_05973 [Pseudomonas fluorescens]